MPIQQLLESSLSMRWAGFLPGMPQMVLNNFS
jgi:hypothetical protein